MVVGSGLAQYLYTTSEGHDFDVSFLASAGSTPPLSIDLLAPYTKGELVRRSIDLNWTPDSYAGSVFMLAGMTDDAILTSADMPSDWMHQNLASLGCQPLRRLCMPGSHDTGMSELTGGTLLVTQEDTLTQWVNIADQLDAGFRYFDIRPVIASGQFSTGHYSEVLGKWVGGNGQDIASLVSQVNNFLAHNNELVILDLSHMFNTDDNWRTLNADEFIRLLGQLQGIQHLYSGPNEDLSALPLNHFIQDGPSVIVLVSDGSVNLPSPVPTGFFPSSALNIFNQYSNTDDPNKMKSDQLSKLAANRKTRDDPMFLLAWTLSTVLDIRQLANTAHASLFDKSKGSLWDTIYTNRATSYPNILSIDGIGAAASDPASGRNVAALSMAINAAVLNGVPCPA